jgi:hypothetical protein
MIPFSKWIEAVSGPQDEAGEDNLDFEKVVEKKLMEIIDKIAMDKNKNRQDVIRVVKDLVNSVGNQTQSGGQQNVGQQQGQEQPQSQPQANMAPTQNPVVAS